MRSIHGFTCNYSGEIFQTLTLRVRKLSTEREGLGTRLTNHDVDIQKTRVFGPFLKSKNLVLVDLKNIEFQIQFREFSNLKRRFKNPGF